MAKKRKKKVQPVVSSKPVETTGQWYWCVNCGHHGDFGYHRKNNVKCEMCGYDEPSLWTLEEINDPFLDNIWLERFKTKKQADKEKESWLYKNPVALKKVLTGIQQAKEGKFAPDPRTESKEPKEKSIQEKLAEIRKIT